MNRGVLVVAAAALLALVAWIAFGEGRGAPAVPPIVPQDDGSETTRPTPAVVDAIDAESERSDVETLTAPVREPASDVAGATGSLRVRVVRADGRAMAHVTVIAAPPFVADARLDEPNAVTDERGEASFSLPAGAYALRTSLGAAADVVVKQGAEHEVVLSLPDAPVVRGDVVDEDGAPVGDAEVLVLGLTAVGTARVSARSQRDGSFELPGIGAGRQISARKDGFAPSPPQRIALADANAKTVTIRLRREHGFVQGTVATRDGNPIHEAVVWFGPGDQDLPQDGAPSRARFAAQVVRTDPDGSFRSPPLPRGPVEVRATARGRALASRRVEVEAAAAIDIRIVLDGGGIARGRLVLADGTPAAQAIVYSGVRRSIGSRLARAASDGSFTLDRLPAGDVELTALALEADGVTQQRAKATIRVSLDSAVEWNPTLERMRRGDVRGIALRDDETPLAGWLVLATPQGQRRGLGTETLTDGTFALHGLQPGLVDVTLRRPESGWQSFPDARIDAVVVDGEPVRIVVPAEATDRATLIGSVRDEQGKPCAATVHVVCRDGSSAQYATRLDGAFRIVGVPQGTVRVRVLHESRPVAQLDPFEVRGMETRDLGVVTLSLGGSVFGKLLGEGDAPPKNATIRLIGAGDRDLGAVDVDASGYRTAVLEAGRYELLVQAESVAPSRVPVEVARGADREVDIRLLPGSLHRFRVTSRDDSDRDAQVSLVVFGKDGKATWAAHLPMVQGEVEFRAWLADGDYEALALGVRDRRAKASFSVAAAHAAAGPGLTTLELAPR